MYFFNLAENKEKTQQNNKKAESLEIQTVLPCCVAVNICGRQTGNWNKGKDMIKNSKTY